MDEDNEALHFHAIEARDASAEPAAMTDITPFQNEILAREDQLNDVAIRNLISTDCYNFDWTSNRQNFTGQRETFIEYSGPTFSVTDETSVVDVFYKMFDSDFVDLLCTETNRYADQKIKQLKRNKGFKPTMRLHRWTPTNRDEMLSFLALTILQGLYPLPNEESYFSFNGFGTMPYFRRVMSYNRYLQIKSMLQFVDNENITETDKLSKIQPISDYFNEKFSTLYYPARDIVVDESLLKGNGRLGFAQKVLTKAAQVGLKTYELCESSSGYLWKFFIYCGKNKQTLPLTRPPETDTDGRTKNAAALIVYDLVTPLLHKGHTLIMDNFYNCPLLARHLKKQHTDCYGTLRLQREFVPESLKTMTKTELRQGEAVASYTSDLSVMVWRDSNIVSMISTYHPLQIKSRQKCNRLTYKPQIVLDYNKSMEGVDRKDQFLSVQPMERGRTRIWYKKLFQQLMNAALFNCFIIYQTANPTMTHRVYRTKLAEQLLKIHRQIDLTTEPRLIMSRTGQTRTTRPRTSTSSRPQLEHRHFPVRTGFKQSRCWMCAQRKVSSRTVWKCLECDVNLCIDECFMKYHT